MAELELSKKMMAMPDKPWLLRGGMFDGEKLIALSLCEKCGETLIIHIEKALYSYGRRISRHGTGGGGCLW